LSWAENYSLSYLTKVVGGCCQDKLRNVAICVSYKLLIVNCILDRKKLRNVAICVSYKLLLVKCILDRQNELSWA